MRRLFRRARELLFPPRCAACGASLPGKGEALPLCDRCREDFLREIEEGCAVCRRPYARCRCRPKGFLPDTLVYALPYHKRDGVCRRMILSCKNRKNKAVMEEIADRTVCAAEKRGILTSEALLTYVPRAPEMEMRTGIDQAEELAKAVSRRTGLPLVRLLTHRFFGEEQKKQAYPLRAESAASLYGLLPGAEAVAGRTVILVDDVVTTGATVNACTACLNEAGAGRVICLAAARSLRGDVAYPH